MMQDSWSIGARQWSAAVVAAESIRPASHSFGAGPWALATATLST